MDEDWYERERLHTAAEDGNLAAVKSLVAEGRDVNATDSGLAMTPLHYAAAAEHLDVVRFLISCGANVNAIDKATAGNTPLGHIAQECSVAMAKTLLDAGANPLIPGMMQVTPLQRAERRKRPEGRQVYELMLKVARSRFHYGGG
jgi:ankyrin repeat protein